MGRSLVLKSRKMVNGYQWRGKNMVIGGGVDRLRHGKRDGEMEGDGEERLGRRERVWEEGRRVREKRRQRKRDIYL